MHNIVSIRPVIAALMLLLAMPVAAISETAKQQGIPTLAPMLEKVTPAVVSIRVSKAMPTGSPFSFGGQIPDELRRFLPDGQQQPNQGRQQYATGAGSGVIIDAANGYVVTNHHVIADAASISVQLNDGRTLEGELLGSDPNTDIALVQVPADQLTELSFAAIDTVDVGDYVVAIGNPFGIGQTVTSGIVSALGRAGLNNEHYEDFIQTDAAINMGNSGGALVDLEGNLVGINTAIISGSGGSNGVGFAVPVDMVTAVIGHLERDGEVRRGLLGVTIADVTPDVTEALELDIAEGALVTSVMPGSAAESAGIEVSDVIVSLGDEAVTGSRELRNMVGLMRRGEEVALRLYRNGEAMTLNAIIGGPEGQVAESEGRSAQSSVYRGAQLRDLSAADLELADEGVLVVDVQARSRAAAAGLRPGDVIVEVNRRSVADLAAFNAAIEGAERLTAISVIREGRSLLLFVPA